MGTSADAVYLNDCCRSLFLQTARVVPNTLVVGKQQDLVSLSKTREEIERGGAALIVEMDKDIIGDERQWLSRSSVVFKAGQAEREEELVARAVAHRRDRHRCARLAAADDDRQALVVYIGVDPCELAASCIPEKFASPAQERILLLASDTVDRFVISARATVSST